jgi:hypothetical protein
MTIGIVRDGEPLPRGCELCGKLSLVLVAECVPGRERPTSA